MFGVSYSAESSTEAVECWQAKPTAGEESNVVAAAVFPAAVAASAFAAFAACEARPEEGETPGVPGVVVAPSLKRAKSIIRLCLVSLEVWSKRLTVGSSDKKKSKSRSMYPTILVTSRSGAEAIAIVGN